MALDYSSLISTQIHVRVLVEGLIARELVRTHVDVRSLLLPDELEPPGGIMTLGHSHESGPLNKKDSIKNIYIYQ